MMYFRVDAFVALAATILMIRMLAPIVYTLWAPMHLLVASLHG